MSVFDGTQPTLTHVPPNVAPSAIATRTPRSAALIAAAKPAEPPPTIKRSNSQPPFVITVGASARLDGSFTPTVLRLRDRPLDPIRRRVPPCHDARPGVRVAHLEDLMDTGDRLERFRDGALTMVARHSPNPRCSVLSRRSPAASGSLRRLRQDRGT